ncbi:MAG: GAF domain-containing protein [Anaerolineales bacterium]|nr:GAF domain-containing protein [Anaerolineales bacterium]MDW8161435.1 GAF domain-containing protein [Anaerolineales bacterium]
MKEPFLFSELHFIHQLFQEGGFGGSFPGEERVARAFDTLADLVLVVDREAVIRYANQAAARRFARTPDQLVGRELFELFPFPKAKARWQVVLKAVHRYGVFSFIDSHNSRYALTHVLPIHRGAATESYYLLYALEGHQSASVPLLPELVTGVQLSLGETPPAPQEFPGNFSLERSLRISLALAHAATGASLAEDLQAALNVVCAQACQALQAPVAVIRLYNPYQDQLELAGSHGLSEEHMAKYHALPYAPLADLASETAPRVFVVDLDQSPPTPADELPYRSELRAAVVGNIVRRDRFLGVLVILVPKSCSTFAKEDLLFVQALAEQASISIERFQLMEVQEKRTRELESLVRIAVALRGALNKKEAMMALVDALDKEHMTKLAATYLLEGDRYKLLLSRGWGWTLPTQLTVPDHPLWRAGKPLFFRQLTDSENLLRAGNYEFSPFEEVSGVAIPMHTPSATAGLLLLGFSSPLHLSDEDRHHLHLLQEISDAALHRADALEHLEQLVLERTRELAILYDVTTLLNAPTDLREAVDQVLEHILSITQADFVAVHLFDPSQNRLCLFADKGSSPSGDGLTLDGRSGEAPWDTVFAQNAALFLVSLEDEITGIALGKRDSYYGLPIRSRGDVLGVLSLFYNKERTFSLNEQVLLTAIADQLGLTIERARLIEQGEEIAKLEERQRLARELHDALTQSLYSMTLLTSGYKRSLNHATLEEIHRWMDELNEVAQNALAELRLLLYELRPTALEQDGLHGALKRRLEAVEKRAGIRAVLEVQGSFRLPPEDEEHFYRIAQEALNNALHHAHHRSILVRIKSTPARFEMFIEDDGKGFDLNQVVQQNQSSGLTNMFTRARQIRAQLSINSSPGRGTTLLVTKDYSHE